MTTRTIVFSLLAVFTLSGPALAEFRSVSGTATYLERIAVPPEAVVQVTLVGPSDNGAPARPLASIIVDPQGRVPVNFVLGYDRKMVRPGRTYMIEAALIVRGEPRFRGSVAAPVLTPGAHDAVTVVMRRSPPQDAGTETAHQSILGEWEVFEIFGQPIEGGRVPALSIAQDGGVAGTGSCNRFNGRAQTGSGTIAFGPVAATQMACPDPLGTQERAFFDALSRVAGFEVHQRSIAMTDDSGAVLLRLAPAN
ncbi:MAG: META domain-containing protein [Pseudomonadota bacterium]